MAIKKKPLYQDDDSLYALRKEDERQWAEFGELAQEVFKDWIKYNDGQSGKEAKSWQDSGRACYKCGNALMIFEMNDAGDLLLQCKKCGTKQWLNDVAPYSQEEIDATTAEAKEVGAEFQHFPDELYRSIPDSLVNEHMEILRKRRLGSS